MPAMQPIMPHDFTVGLYITKESIVHGFWIQPKRPAWK